MAASLRRLDKSALGETRRRAVGDDFEVDFIFEALVLSVDAQNFNTTGEIRNVNGDLTVETARTKERRVENVGARWSPT